MKIRIAKRLTATDEVDAFMFAEKKMRVIGNRAKELQNFGGAGTVNEPIWWTVSDP